MSEKEKYQVLDLSSVADAVIRVVPDISGGDGGWMIMFDDQPYIRFEDNHEEEALTFANSMLEMLDVGYVNGIMETLNDKEKAQKELTNRHVEVKE